MKKFVFTIAFVLIGILVLTGCEKPSKIDSNITSFKYSYGSYASGYYSYSLFIEDGKVLFLTEGKNGIDLSINKEVDSSYLTELEEIINSNGIYEWNGFNKSDNSITDGRGFELKVVYENGETIEASGYEVFPTNYEDCQQALIEFFQNIG